MSGKPQLHPGVLRRDVEDELLLYDPRTGETLLLNATAASVAELCDGTRDAADIAGVIVSLLREADGEVVLADVHRAVQELGDAGMLEPDP